MVSAVKSSFHFKFVGKIFSVSRSFNVTAAFVDFSSIGWRNVITNACSSRTFSISIFGLVSPFLSESVSMRGARVVNFQA